jgi:hypothetical protein
MGKKCCFRKKIPYICYENFVEDSNNLAKIRRNILLPKIFTSTWNKKKLKKFAFWRKRKSNEKGVFVSPSIQIRSERNLCTMNELWGEE